MDVVQKPENYWSYVSLQKEELSKIFEGIMCNRISEFMNGIKDILGMEQYLRIKNHPCSI